MGIGQYRAKFKDCIHDWKLHVDADSTGGPAAGNTVFLCSNCGTIITMLEKNSLDSLLSQETSLKIQEQSIRIFMWANIIASITIVIAFVVLLFGEGLLR